MKSSKRQRIETLGRVARLVLVTALLFPPHLWAATITVTGTCTLGNAVTAANTNATSGGCPAGSGADTLVLTGNVALTAKLPDVTSDVTVDGGGFTVTRTAGSFGIFTVTGSGTLTLDSVTVSNGASSFYGAGVHVAFGGELFLVNSTVTGNSGTGVFANYNSQATITNSTISNNTVDGVFAYYYSTVSVTNSTISNSQGSSVRASVDSLVTLTNSTIVGRSDGLPSTGLNTSFGGEIEVENSVVARHVSGGGCYGNCRRSPQPGGACPVSDFVDQGGNFADDSTCGTGFDTLTGLDPVLADNGGPTLTHALLSGSSAIDAAGTCGLATDQRGVPRDDGFCDSGAFEFVVLAPSLSCVGFEAPMHQSPMTVNGKMRALPLKAQLLDEESNPVTDFDLIAPPVVQVLFDSGGGGSAVDVSDDVLPVGLGDEGNQFVFADSRWRFNLKTSNFTASGTYLILMVSGDDTEYVVDPTCQVEFVTP